MQKHFVTLWMIVLFQTSAFAGGRLLSAVSSSEEDIFRLELQFDRAIDTNKVGLQFQDKNLVLVVPESSIRKTMSPITVKPSYINEVKIADSKDGKVAVELQFTDLQALQMKENLAMETVGNGMIIEVLPPTLNKAEAPAVTDAVAGKAIGQSSGQIAGEPSLPVANGDTIKTEKEIPLFSKKEANPAESSGMTKIAFMVFAIVALGGYMLWSMKNRSKMVNGPESLMKIKVITQFHLGPKKTLAVVRVAGESLLLGITESQISLIKTLSLLDEDLPEVGAGTFAAALGEQTEPSRKTHVESEIENVAEEEFAFGPAVKTTLSQKIPMLRRII